MIEAGDCVYWDNANKTVRPASDLAWDTDLATTQGDFVDLFVGMSADSRSGDTVDVQVDSAGVKEFDCDAAKFEIGDLVGMAKQTGNALENQKVVSVSSASQAIGRVAKRYSSNTTSVMVEIFPKMLQSPN